MEATTTILILVAIIIAQQVQFHIAIQKLVNKLMSRDFVEYRQVTKKPEPPVTRVKIEDDDVREDLGTLNGL